jgi:hypothetical protein
VIELAIKQPEWSPRELATAFVASGSIVLERRRSTDVMDGKIDPTTTAATESSRLSNYGEAER